MRKYLFGFILACITLATAAQPVNGDYMTVNAGPWNLATNWNRHDGVTWLAAVTAPSAASAQQITIMNGHTITATTNVTADQLVIAAGGALVITNNITFTVNDGVGNDLFCDGDLHFANGTISGIGASALTVAGTMFWAAGIMNAALNVSSGGVLTLDNPDDKIIDWILTINSGGVMNWNNGNIRFNSGGLNNSGTINNNFDGTMNNLAGGGTINNNAGGEFNKTGGSGGHTHFANLTWNNHGTLHMEANQVFANTAGAIVFHPGNNITGAGKLLLAGGTHQASGSPVNTGPGNIQLDGGTYSAGTLNIDGNMFWTSGIMNAVLNVTASGVLTVDSTNDKILDFILNVLAGGIMNWNNGTIRFNSGTLNNWGTINNNFDGVMNNLAGSGSINNNTGGIFNKTGGSGGNTNFATLTWNNHGTLHMEANQVFANTAGVFNFHSGSSVTGNGRLLLLGGTHQAINNPITTGPGNIQLDGGVFTHTASGSLTVTGNFFWTAGTVNGTLNVGSGGVLALDSTDDKFIDFVLTVQSGGVMNWNNGTIRFNSGTLNNNGIINNNFDGTINIFAGSAVMNNNSGGVFNKTGGAGGRTHFSNATWNNHGVLNVETGQVFANTAGTFIFHVGSSISGAGKLLLAGGSHQASGSPVNTGPGNIQLDGGTYSAGVLNLNGNLFWTAGILNATLNVVPGGILTLDSVDVKIIDFILTVQSGGVMNWNNGTIQFNSGTLNNNGIINNNFDGTINILAGSAVMNNNSGGVFNKTGGAGGRTHFSNATWNNHGVLNVEAGQVFANTAGTFVFHAGSSITGAGKLLLAGGSHQASGSPVNTGPGNVQLDGGIFAAGILNVTGNFYWTAGNVNATLNVNSGGVLNLDSADVKLLDFIIDVKLGGIMNWNNGIIRFNSGTLDNSGTINNSFDGVMDILVGSAVINNKAGAVFNKTGGSGGRTHFSIATWNNYGTLNVDAGQVFANTAGTFIFHAGSSVTGAGKLLLAGGSHQAVGSPVSTGPGNIQLDGGTYSAGVLNVDGQMFWTAGILNATLNVVSGGVLTLDSTDIKLIDFVLTVQSGGVMNWNNGTIRFNSGTLNNNGTINANFDGIINVQAGGGTVNNNTGAMFRKMAGTGGATSLEGITFNNHAIIYVETNQILAKPSGTFNFHVGSSVNGPGKLLLSGGSHQAVGSPVSTGPGNIQLDGGTYSAGVLNLNGNLFWTAGILNAILNVVPGGILTLDSVDAKIIDFVLTVQSGGVMNWNNGTIRFNSGTLNNTGIINCNFDGTINILAGSAVVNNNSGGVFRKMAGTGGSTNLDGITFNNHATIYVEANQVLAKPLGVFNFHVGSSVTGAGKLLLSGGAHQAVGSPVSTGPGNIQLDGGTYSAGVLNLNGNLFWTAGILNATLNVVPGGILTIDSVDVKIIDFVLSVQSGGVMNWNNGTIRFNSGTLNNSGIINCNFDGTINILAGAGTINNNTGGIFRKMLGSGGSTSMEGLTFNNHAEVFVEANQRLTKPTGTFNFHTGNNVTGNGRLVLAGGSHIAVNNPINSGPGNIQLDGGTFTNSGAGSLTVTGNVFWTGGIINGTFNVGSIGILTLDSTDDKIVDFLLTVQSGGIMNWNNGTIRFNSGTINNNGTINSNFDGTITFIAGSAVLNNNASGSFLKTAGSGTTSLLNITTNNTGTIGGIGTISITGGVFTNTGIVNPGLSTPGLLTVNSATPLFNANTSLNIAMVDGSGEGIGHDIMQRAGNLTLNGTLNVTSTQAVPLGTYVILRLTSGTISGNFSTVNIPPDYTLSQTSTTVSLTRFFFLPVSLVDFSVKEIGNYSVELNWKTATETNSSHFVVERSSNGTLFTAVGQLAAAGNSTDLLMYRLVDPSLPDGIYFYRLKQVDLDGKFEYSKIIKISINRTRSVKVVLNPVGNTLMVATPQPFTSMDLIDAGGRIVKRFGYNASQQYDVSNVTAGIYFLRVMIGNEVMIKQIIKQ